MIMRKTGRFNNFIFSLIILSLLLQGWSAYHELGLNEKLV